MLMVHLHVTWIGCKGKLITCRELSITKAKPNFESLILMDHFEKKIYTSVAKVNLKKNAQSSIEWVSFVSIHCTHNLQVRNADIEALIHIGVPYNPNISDKEGSQVTLRDKQGTKQVFQRRWSLNCPASNFILLLCH